MKRRVQSVQEMTFGGAAFGTGFPHMLALSKPTMSGEAGLAVVFPDSKEPMPMWVALIRKCACCQLQVWEEA